MKRRLKLLIAEDTELDAKVLILEFSRKNISVDTCIAESKEQFTSAFSSFSPDAIICDYYLKDFNALDALEFVRSTHSEIPFIVVSNKIDDETAVETMMAGADDYVMKTNLSRLVPAVQRELQKYEYRREKKLKEHALAESEERFKTLFEMSPDTYYLMDMNGRFIDGNEAAEELIGYRRDELIGKSVFEIGFLPPESIEVAKEALKIALRTDQPFLREYRLQRKDGSFIVVEIKIRRISLNGQTVLLGAVRDITKQKEYEQKLQENEHFFHSLFMTSPDSILLFDHHSSDVPWKIIDCNEAACRINGYTRDELIGASVDKVIGRELTSEERAAHIQTLRENEITHFETVHTHRDGHQFPLDVASSIVTINGRELILGIDRDISQRKHFEEAIKKSESQLSSAVKMARLGHWEYDVETDLFTFNNHFYSMLRTNIDTVGAYTMSSGEYAKRFVHPDDMDIVQEETRKAIETTNPNYNARFEHRVIFGDGSIGTISVQKFIRKNKQGKTIIVYGVNQDITEQKKTNEMLELLKLSVDTNNDAAFWTSPDGSFLYVNDSSCTQLGYSRDELLHMKVYDINPKAKKDPRAWDRAWKILREKKFIHLESVHQRKDGTTYPVEVNSSYVVFGDREYNCGFARDISDRKRIEKQLLYEQEHLQALMDNIPDLVYFKDSQSRFLRVSKAMAERIGVHNPADLIGRTDFGYFSEDHAKKAYEDEKQIMETGIPKINFEEKETWSDGTETWVSTTKVPLRKETGEIIGTFGISRDITDRKLSLEKEKKLETQLFQAQKMESIGTLAGGIAHDFNNILGIILGHATLIERVKDDPEIRKTSIQTISKAVQRGAAIVKQILTFARSGDVVGEIINVNQFVDDIVKMLRETMPRTIDIVVDHTSARPIINVDPSQLQQAIMNLCINARDAMMTRDDQAGGTGKLTIETGKISGSLLREKYSDAQASDYIKISISDTGCGMDEKVKAKIFDPFYTTKPIGKGTGLGLAVVYGVLKSHNAFIDVQSQIGKGSTFDLFFPSAASYEVQEEEESSSVQNEPLTGHGTILVVDDEESLLSILTKVIESAGYTVLTAQDGVEALNIFKKQKDQIDLVLTDIGLPLLDGKEVFAMMKIQKPDVKVILASGYLDAEYKSEMLKAGAKEFIQKPYHPENVVKKIREVLDEK